MASYPSYIKIFISHKTQISQLSQQRVSLGSCFAIKAMRRSGDRELSDDWILGSGEFVEQVIQEAAAKIKYQLPVKEHHQKNNEFLAKCNSSGFIYLDLVSNCGRKIRYICYKNNLYLGEFKKIEYNKNKFLKGYL